MYLPTLIPFIRKLFTDDDDISDLSLPWGAPFNPENYFQWFLLWFIQCSYGVAYSGGTLTVTAFFIGCCYYLQGLCNQFSFLIESIENELTPSPCQENEESSGNSENSEKAFLKMKLKLYKSIDVHSSMFE